MKKFSLLRAFVVGSVSAAVFATPTPASADTGQPRAVRPAPSLHSDLPGRYNTGEPASVSFAAKKVKQVTADRLTSKIALKCPRGLMATVETSIIQGDAYAEGYDKVACSGRTQSLRVDVPVRVGTITPGPATGVVLIYGCRVCDVEADGFVARYTADQLRVR